tara:strand:+ start:1485 stop:1670 length:186 start_codon:yes stop_codon:yes gene_type:complete
MKRWPEELSYNDIYFPIIMNDWMQWEDIHYMIDIINYWISKDKPNITTYEADLIHEMIGVT